MLIKVKSFFSAKGEFLFFCLIIVLTALPVLRFTFFPTLDGPAHLYNSNLLQTLLFRSDPVIDTYFKINTTPVPNWFVQVLLPLFNFIMPAQWAEKILLLLYIAGLPLTFRYMVVRINPSGALLSYFIFPFIYSFMLHLGLYNFCFSVILLLLGIHYWISHHSNLGVYNFLVITALVTLVFFSHIIIWGVLFIGLFFIALSVFFRDSVVSGSRKKIFQRTLLFLVIAYLPSATLFIEYLGWIPKFWGSSTVPFDEKLSWIRESRALIALDRAKESFYTSSLFFLVLSLSVILIYRKVSDSEVTAAAKNFFRRAVSFLKTFITANDHFLFTAIAVLILFLQLPSTLGFIIGGFVTEKLCFLIYLFFILWIASKHWQRWIKFISIVVILWIHLNLISSRWGSIKELDENARECIAIAEKIETDAIVLPVNYSVNWLHAHFSNYLGIEKPLVILENFQANDGYFPLVWKYARVPDLRIDTVPSDGLCLKWPSNRNNPVQGIEYVLVWGDFESKNDACALWLKSILAEKYRLMHKSKIAGLYRYDVN